MKLGTRARLAWLPLALWCAAGLWIGYVEAIKWKGDDVQDWIILALGGLFLFAGGVWNLWRVRAKAAERARVEGADVDEPVTWHRKRSEERRVGKECGLLCRSRWSPYH